MKQLPVYKLEDFIQHTYMAIKNTNQFMKVSLEWTTISATNHATEQKLIDHFKTAYNIFHAKQDLLAAAGITNTV